ncbi:MAG: hypothetical protein KI793_03370 [Rivularia sp. (in: Bacteria)]|nr:hypothetical protein [Rivularia sp. MS3]
MNTKLAKIISFLAKSANTIANNELDLSGTFEMTEAEIELEDLQQAVIHLKDAVDVMKPLENSPLGVEIHDLTTAFLFLESARDALFRASIPNAAKAMNKVIKNIKLACKTKSIMYQKILIARVLDSLNRVLHSIEKSIDNVVTPIVTHMTYEELLSKLAAYSSGTVY